ncbi:YcxB family protein [Novosphingobium cyanobacteriorum]|uniref:YcxB family protein n=1 Tax=Novosphingobium cyanobacteriorum TaxID=3024215 RepID=A0ABT6CJV8_9SPHN|nr:YcxB family protein [Novosphingobium cyanobacteriorum]MDF8334092.1 YcxB family protein [Novosphingobium cyanobacteriorum]
MSDQSVTFTTYPDFKDWLSAYWLTVRHRWLWKRICIAFVFVWTAYFALVAGIDIANAGWHPQWLASWLRMSAVYSLTVSAVLILITIAATPRRVRKAVEDTKRLAPQTDYEADQSGIRSRNAISTSSVNWSQFERWLENGQVFVLMLTRANYFIVRKADLDSSTLESLRSLLVAANVPSR